MKYIVGLLFLLSVNTAYASEYQKDIDSFFKSLKEGDVEIAITDLYRSNPYVSSVPDQIINLKTQLSALPGLVGELNLLEKVDTYKVSDILHQVTYVATYDRQPVRFEFQYFKIKTGWRIYSMSFDSDLTDELQKFARKNVITMGN